MIAAPTDDKAHEVSTCLFLIPLSRFTRLSIMDARISGLSIGVLVSLQFAEIRYFTFKSFRISLERPEVAM